MVISDAGAYSTGGLLQGPRQPNKAHPDYEKARELDPAAAAYYQPGECYSKQGKTTPKQ
jgi:hypothetical protein